MTGGRRWVAETDAHSLLIQLEVLAQGSNYTDPGEIPNQVYNNSTATHDLLR